MTFNIPDPPGDVIGKLTSAISDWASNNLTGGLASGWLHCTKQRVTRSMITAGFKRWVQVQPKLLRVFGCFFQTPLRYWVNVLRVTQLMYDSQSLLRRQFFMRVTQFEAYSFTTAHSKLLIINSLVG